MDNESRSAVFIEVHKVIDDVAQAVIDAVSGTENPVLSYPPGVEFSASEMAILSGIKLTGEQRAVLRKIIVDACSYPTFHMMSLLDGVTDPQVIDVPDWTGGNLATSGGDQMLHDEFYETYREYEGRKEG